MWFIKTVIHGDGILWYLQPSRYKDGLQSKELLILASLSVWESRTSFPATQKKTKDKQLH